MPRVTIIETGLVSPKNRELHGSYPQMFEQMIGAADATVTFNTVSIPAGEPLPDIEGLEAILITGSAAGVYDASTGSRRSRHSCARPTRTRCRWSASASAIN